MFRSIQNTTESERNGRENRSTERVSLYKEGSARTLGVVDVHDWQERFNVKNADIISFPGIFRGTVPTTRSNNSSTILSMKC